MTVNSWRSMAEGDNRSFLLLYHTYYQALFCYGFSLSVDRELTKDCIQELFVEIWTTRSSLNKDVKNVRSYLFTWLRRKISRELSRLAKETVFNEATDESGPCGLPAISVCHYGEQNGDLMRDPEMCFELGLGGGAHLNPFYWRNDYAGI